MKLIIVSISPKCIAVYYPFHECGISLKDKSENMQEIDNNQNEIILFPPSSLFINVGLKEITSAYANFLLFEFISTGEWKVIKLLACVASVSNRVIARKLERKQKKVWRGRGEKETFIPLPLPRHSFYFLLLPSFLDELREETLATQAIKLCPYWSSARRNQKN